MQSFKKIYSVIMKLNRFFALHFFANDLYRSLYFLLIGNNSIIKNLLPGDANSFLAEGPQNASDIFSTVNEYNQLMDLEGRS